MILAVNTGSSSLKLGVFEDERAVWSLSVEDVGQAQGNLTISGAVNRETTVAAKSHAEAYRSAVEQFSELGVGVPEAVGHRVVHGGPCLQEHQRITPELVEELRDAVHFAPLHIPASLELIEETEQQFPKVPQFACFDTAFHRTLPEAALRFALPSELWDQGVRRYGFHGLSCESVVARLQPVPEKLVVAHLGSGASVTAVLRGNSVDTSMGMTPTGGLVMSSRSGDLDPGVLVFLMRTRDLSADQFEELLNKSSGLLALAGTPSMKDIQADASERGRLAFDIFCRQVAKFVAGYASVLGGLDMLVFTGGIGEHSAAVRDSVRGRLEFLPKYEIRVMASEEDLQIARHCARLLKG